MKKFLVALIVLALIGAMWGFYIYYKPVPKSLENVNPDLTISAEQLIRDYKSNETEADKKYLGKLLIVSGKINDIKIENEIKKITLETSDPTSSVTFDFDVSINIGNVKIGDDVKIKGNCTGFIGDVILNQSSIVK